MQEYKYILAMNYWTTVLNLFFEQENTEERIYMCK